MPPAGPNPLDTLSASQRALLRIVCWVAWSDGDFALKERELLETLVSRLLAQGSEAVAEETVRALALEQLQNADVEALVAALDGADERQLAVKLALQMVSIVRNPGDEAVINRAEKQAYRRLVEALALPESEIQEAEWAAREELKQQRSLLELLSGALNRFGAWPDDRDASQGTLPMGYWL